MDYNSDELQFENLSGAESIEEEDRTSEIKQLLAQAFSNETFDDESEHSFLVNDSSDQSTINGLGVVDNYNISHRNNNEKDDTAKNTMTENGLHSFCNGIVLDKEDGHNGDGRLNGSKKVRFRSISPVKENDNDSPTTQQSRGTDEIEESNPAMSLLHQKHCPQNEDDEIGSDIWTESGNVVERLKTICQLRERQIQRAEESINSLSEDKKSLSHHIGLMKTEMIQMKTCQDELEKVIVLRDEEIKYLKSRITEGIGEYEKVQKREEATKKECEGYKDQVKFHEQEVEDCKTKLTILPSQLYKEWQKQQHELGLFYGGNHKSTAQDNLRDSGSNKTATTGLSSHTFGQKECSSVVVQTDETLETYQLLGNLIEKWAKEVADSSKRAELAEHELTLTQTKLIRLKNKFQEYHLQSLVCRKKWQEQVELFRQKYEDNRADCIAILSKVSDKLDIDIMI